MHAAPQTLVLVRVQDDLHGAFMGKGGLTLPYLRDDKDRNTLHFTLNCIVQDHAYGKFNLDDQGQLKAKIVLLTDLRDMPPPAGLGQADTWYRLDSVMNEDTGKVDRSLALGAATIVAPVGTEIPAGAKAIFYDGGIDARDAAVKQYFDARQIPMEAAGMRCWQGDSEAGAFNWAKDTAKSLFGESHVHTEPHACSIDSDLESLGTQGLVAGLKTQRISSDNGLDVPYIDKIESKSATSIKTLEAFLVGLPAAERQRVGLHYEAQIAGLKADLEHARALDAGWLESQRMATISAIASDLQALPGKGCFYLAQKDNQAYENLDAQALAARIAGDSVSLGQKIWRDGMTPEWTPIRATAMAGIVAPGTGAAPQQDNGAGQAPQMRSWVSQRTLINANTVASLAIGEVARQRQTDYLREHQTLQPTPQPTSS